MHGPEVWAVPTQVGRLAHLWGIADLFCLNAGLRLGHPEHVCVQPPPQRAGAAKDGAEDARQAMARWLLASTAAASAHQWPCRCILQAPRMDMMRSDGDVQDTLKFTLTL